MAANTTKLQPGSSKSPQLDKNQAIENISESSVEIDPAEERAFVRRLDLGFLIVGFLGYMFKYIDQTNIVSKETEKREYVCS